jgi:ABC-type transporter Mla subunit MlaD
VPEISAQDLRRLRALEERLEKAQDERRSFTAERRDLRARATLAEREARAADARTGEVEQRLEALLTENGRLAARLDEISSDADKLRGAATRLREQLDAAKQEVREGAAETKRLAKSLAKAETEGGRLTERLTLAEAQLKSKTTTPVLPAREVARLIDGFVEEIGGGLPGLAVRDGEIRLNVAFGKVGRATGFVVPTADAPADVRKNLHEVAVRFDRTRELDEPD